MKTNLINGPKIYLKLNILIILFLFFANFFFIKDFIFNSSEEVSRVARFFWFDDELNLPTLYSGLGLLFAAFLSFYCSLIKEIKKREKTFWRILGILFCFLTLDETVMIHERIEKYIYLFVIDKFDFVYTKEGSWTVFYILPITLFSLFILRFLKILPKRILNLLKFSLLIYVSGAMIIEFLIFQILGLDQGSYIYFFLSITEEIFEILGICFYNYAILKYIFSYQNLLIEG